MPIQLEQVHTHVEQAANVAWKAKQPSRRPAPEGDGRGSIIIERAVQTFTEFNSSQDVPPELKLAASSLWEAVKRADPASLHKAAHGHASERHYVESEGGWHLGIIRDGYDFGEVANNMGLALTRTTGEPGSPHTDVYVWVRPENRKQGVASKALDQVRRYSEGELTMPFGIDPTDVATAKLMARYVQITDVAT